MGILANSEDPDEMQQKLKKNFRQKNTIYLENYNLTPLDMYNGLSQVYYIKPQEIDFPKSVLFFLLSICLFFHKLQFPLIQCSKTE